MLQRDILYFTVPAFPIAVARVIDSALRDYPVAVAATHSERALIHCASPEAVCEGVRNGMPVHLARRFCPKLKLLSPDPSRDRRAMQSLIKIAGEYSPQWETGQAGSLYLDMTGSSRLFGPGRDSGVRLERTISNRLNLAGQVGVAANKLVARIAADCLDKAGICDVLRGNEQPFIAPFAVTVLPGIGMTRSAQLLTELNLRHIEELARLSLAQLRLLFGTLAPLLQQRARGIDPSPVQPPRQSPEIEEETVLDEAANDDDVLLAELCRLVEACGLRLRRLGKRTRQLVMILNYANGVSEKGNLLLPQAENRDSVLLEKTEELFLRICQRRVRLTGMRLQCRQLTEAAFQLDLFAASDPVDSSRLQHLQDALDQLRERHGMTIIQRGRSMVGQTPQH